MSSKNISSKYIGFNRVHNGCYHGCYNGRGACDSRRECSDTSSDSPGNRPRRRIRCFQPAEYLLQALALQGWVSGQAYIVLNNRHRKGTHGAAYDIRNGLRRRSGGCRRLGDCSIRRNCITQTEVSIALELRSSIVAACNLHGDARTAVPRTSRATALDRPAIVSIVVQASWERLENNKEKERLCPRAPRGWRYMEASSTTATWYYGC